MRRGSPVSSARTRSLQVRDERAQIKKKKKLPVALKYTETQWEVIFLLPMLRQRRQYRDGLGFREVRVRAR